MHKTLITDNGIHIIENVRTDLISDVAAKSGRATFFLSMRVPKAVGLSRTLPSFKRKRLIWFAAMVSVCLRSERNAEQIEGAVLCAGGGGEDGGEAIAPEADEIAGERGEITEQGVEAVHWERFALCRVSAFAGDLALRRR